MQTRILKTVLGTSAAAVAVLGLALNAGAENYQGEWTKTTAERLPVKSVSYDDLDLTSDKARAALQYRISAAAKEVCGSTELRRAGGLRQAALNRECIARAVDSAMRQVPDTRVAVSH